MWVHLYYTMSHPDKRVVLFHFTPPASLSKFVFQTIFTSHLISSEKIPTYYSASQSNAFILHCSQDHNQHEHYRPKVHHVTHIELDPLREADSIIIIPRLRQRNLHLPIPVFTNIICRELQVADVDESDSHARG